MTEEEIKNHSYLGDGVYAEFDGYGITLRTANHEDHLCDDKIYLEPDVFKSLYDFVKNVTKEKEIASLYKRVHDK